MTTTVWLHARLATMVEGTDPYGVIEDGALVVENGRIAWVGSRTALPFQWQRAPTQDCGGVWITPGLIDCHTHIVHAGCRAGEFEQRLNGVSYEEIARAGGGILSSVRATQIGRAHV
jgi:imidazolonepropionase